MAYLFMSNINDFDDINNSDKAYQTVNIEDIINFTDNNNINREASFLMIRAHKDNDILVQILPYGYGVLIPAAEMWSVDAINKIEGISIKNIFAADGTTELQSGKIQWMIGYK